MLRNERKTRNTCKSRSGSNQFINEQHMIRELLTRSTSGCVSGAGYCNGLRLGGVQRRAHTIAPREAEWNAAWQTTPSQKS